MATKKITRRETLATMATLAGAAYVDPQIITGAAKQRIEDLGVLFGRRGKELTLEVIDKECISLVTSMVRAHALENISEESKGGLRMTMHQTPFANNPSHYSDSKTIIKVSHIVEIGGKMNVEGYKPADIKTRKYVAWGPNNQLNILLVENQDIQSINQLKISDMLTSTSSLAEAIAANEQRSGKEREDYGNGIFLGSNLVMYPKIFADEGTIRLYSDRFRGAVMIIQLEPQLMNLGIKDPDPKTFGIAKDGKLVKESK